MKFKSKCVLISLVNLIYTTGLVVSDSYWQKQWPRELLAQANTDNLNTTLNPFICMSELRYLGCHPAGVELSLILSNLDDRCKNLNKNDQKILRSQQLYYLKRTAATNSRRCPCKFSFGGPKCDTCQDGYHIKFSQHQSDQDADSNPLLSQVRQNYTRQFRMFTCKSCDCNPFGSKSHTCDKRNGTCFCVDGHTGTKCDKCALGYYNATEKLKLKSDQPSGFSGSIKKTNQVAPTPGRCLECGQCFNQWHIAIMDNKEMSIEMIRRTHDLSQSLTSSMGVKTFNLSSIDDNPDQNNAKLAARLVLSGSQDSFNELDEKITMIGEKLLATKQNSDRLNLLAAEIDGIKKFFNESKTHLDIQQADFDQIVARIFGLNFRIDIQMIEIDHIGQLLNGKLRLGLMAIQEMMPRGAYRLIKENLSISNRSFINSIERIDRFILDSAPIRAQVDNQLEQIMSNRSILNSVGKNILQDSLKLNKINTSELDDELLYSLATHLWNDYPREFKIPETFSKFHIDNLDAKLDLARLLNEESIAELENYVSKTSSRDEQISYVSVILSQSVEIINETEKLIQQISSTMYSLGNNIASFNDSGPCDLSILLQNKAQFLRTTLDRVDSKLVNSQLEMSELLHQNSTSGSIEQILNLSDEINKAIETNINQLILFSGKYKVELDELHIVHDQSKRLVSESENLNEKLNKLREIRYETKEIVEQTKSINRKLNEELFESVITLVGLSESGSILVSLNNIRSQKNETNQTDKSLLIDIEALENRMQNLRLDSSIRRLNHQRVLGKQFDSLNKIVRSNKKLLDELKEIYQQVLFCISSMEIEDSNYPANHQLTGDYPRGTQSSVRSTRDLNEPETMDQTASADENELRKLMGMTAISDRTSDGQVSSNTSNRFRSLVEQKRYVDIVSGYQFVARELYKSLGLTANLSQEFASHEATFEHQLKTIEFLNVEMDKINEDLLQKLDSYEISCS